MNIFLRAKHWQLFLLFIGIPFIMQMLGIILMITTRNGRLMFVIFPLMTILFSGTLFAWLYILSINLHRKLPENTMMNITRFKVLFWIAVFFLLATFGYMFTIPFSSSHGSHGLLFGLLMVPGTFLYMFCAFYVMYFIAKELKTVELQRDVMFSDYIGEFLLLWFFPVGVWVLQPRINKLFASINLEVS